MADIPTKYNPKDTEEKWYKFWEEKGFFRAKVNPKKKPYCIVIPPPNITGILHMGHALNNAIQDIYIRFKRMQGYETLWMPGTDHAGIATQNVVEKRLSLEGKVKESLGREKFLEEVWIWREKYGSTIINQLKKLGCSCDWARTRFTMDEGLSNAVLEVFIKLYKKNLIYRGDYIINWCPRCKTALSDEEAAHRDVDGMLYYIKYPIEGADHVVLATTRPETMLGDVAVCVNPKDKRYKHLKGKTAILPILNRKLKVIFDRKVDPKFGTGILKVTPAHDPVDFELGNIHKLEPINVMNEDATINEEGCDFKGMDRFEAREAIIEELKERDLFVKSEPHKHAVGHCYRCHTMVEPRLSKQWFVKMKPLAKPALEAVRKGKIKFYPKRWSKVYINWMENIRDWCISRQIWWGHRLPVYYCKKCMNEGRRTKDEGRGVIVSKIKPDKCPECGSTEIEQDPDVLDTWFSSWLWPFSTFGWPEKTKELKYFYPTDVLVTAQEIIFFWVARMIMAGLEFMKDIPFGDVYIHGTVRDDTGTKMSKSLGNIIDPLDIINQFGSDALRFSIISITAQGQDVFLSPQKFEIGRNFANKLWNASRLVLMNLKEDMVKKDLCETAADPSLTLAEKWILSRFYQALGSVGKSLEAYRINDAASRIYDFLWHEFCDWYLEIAKLTISEPHTQVTLYKVLEKSLRVLHPLMPFITEEIWQRLPREHDTDSIMITSWPHMQKEFIDKKADREMALLIDVIQSIRNLRATWRIEHSRQIDVLIKTKKKSILSSLKANATYIKKLARVANLNGSTTLKKPPHAAFSVIGDTEIFVQLEGIIDVEKEKKRLGEKHDNLRSELKAAEARLKNKNFVAKAPEDVVKKARERKESLKTEIRSLKKNLSAL
ncbi:MAG: valine--tRNA ligase [Candidatus Omnitrophota bacterium]